MNQPAARTQQQLTASRMACVRRWQGLDPQAKLAWGFLWYRANERPGTVTVHTGEIGLDQGVAYPERSGRKAIEALRKAGLIQVHEHDGGMWTFYLVDPVELRDAILRVATPDAQPQLFEDEAPTAPVAEEPPASIPIEGASASTRALRTEGEQEFDDAPKNKSEGASATPSALAPCKETITITDHIPICAPPEPTIQDKAKGASATPSALAPPPIAILPSRADLLAQKAAQQAARTAAANSDPPTIGDAALQFFSTKRDSFADLTAKLETRIAATVADPTLYQGKIAEVARAAAGNDKFYSELQALLDMIAQKFGTDPAKAKDRGRYFNTSVTRMHNRHGTGKR